MMPDDPMYIPVQVGARGKKDLSYQKDDEGEIEKLRMQWGSVCGKSLQYLEEVREQFRQEKQNLIWMSFSTGLMENLQPKSLS